MTEITEQKFAPRTPTPNSSDVEAVTDAAIRRAHDWLSETDSRESHSESKATEQLAELVRDPNGVHFTMDFVDRVARPEDNKVAAQELRKLTDVPDFLGPINKAMLGLGGLVGKALPDVVMPLARQRMRQMVGHLVLDADGKALNSLLDKAAAEGNELNLNLLGEAVLGNDEADDRAERTIELIRNPRVTYVSVKASSLCAQLNPWDIEGSTQRLKEQLRPIYRAAMEQSPQVFINLDMEEYKDLHLTIKLFTELLSEDEFTNLETGIVLQAYLPDTYDALVQLAEFAAERRAAGGAPIKVRLVKGANLSMEHVEAELHGWTSAPYSSKPEVDANYLRLLDYILQPEHADNIRIGVASHNLFTVALAWELAVKRGVERQIDAEMLQGMSPSQARAVRDVVGRMILYTPVVNVEDFDVAVSYLVRRLEETSEPQNFLPALFAPEVEGPDDRTPMGEQEDRFRAAVDTRWTTFAGPRRTQDRNLDSGTQAVSLGRFVNEPDTDPALRANREWALNALQADPGEPVNEEVTDSAVVDTAVARAKQLAQEWGARSGAERADVLDRIADALADARGELVSVMAFEANKTVDQSDPEVSEAIDFATYYAESARALDDARSVFTPHEVVVVTPPWNFPVAIPVGGMLASLAAGSAVIIKPAPQVVRCAEIAVDAIHRGMVAAGVDTELLQLVRADEGEAGERLITHEDVDSIILTGATDTAKLFRSWKPELKINAETSGKNAMIITPSADPDLAVADLYMSAFGHSGQKCSAASLVILVGPQAESKRFLNQLLDAVRTLKVGPGTDISTTMNGLVEPPTDKLQRGLTVLEPGERWLIKPEQLNEEGTLWSPGVRDGVQPGSWYHTHECFGPILGIMHAKDLDQAIDWQNSTGFGLTGGIHSLDNDEIEHWIDRVEVGNAYVNRGITGAIVQRQSFGGWKNSVLGNGAKAGGPNYVAQQGTWADGDLKPRDVAVRPAIARLLRDAAQNYTDYLGEEDVAWLWRAAELDELAWREEFGVEHDATALTAEANVFRYRPLLAPLRVRLGAGYQLRDLLRLEIGAMVTGTELDVSAGQRIARHLHSLGLAVRQISDDAFDVEIAEDESVRVRTLGEVDSSLRDAAVESSSVILDAPVLADGRRELLHLLLEQAVSVTMHRFGIIRETGNLKRF
ncbi:bifunctional proline dehydrogenase/L-glutamate gamma-semialdehyde dehydrogenase [Corynebacterium halotolerans]|uniref:bifunctional proline dehydrogenase/L-glutamate gamma-semialdehyde dehydrogenase n=1 Tax=Corynebacterium halotolerans TaxID=225326 RepID=UPI003CF603C7